MWAKGAPARAGWSSSPRLTGPHPRASMSTSPLSTVKRGAGDMCGEACHQSDPPAPHAVKDLWDLGRWSNWVVWGQLCQLGARGSWGWRPTPFHSL